ncbi:hypothetical protein [Solicola gregarius]|uniref:Lipoprotein n=1 Tax=Solicola gregarius TaxID=2908642 RepID=A0AA46TJK6_9ACTN|nr:hypothetical protein [Solicola gregarius]UYM06517.1 hypothetical protein L0C25_05440 [Solicola gregarius]
MKRIRVGMAAAAMLALSACGSMHPGAAVVVGDVSVSADKVDDLADNLCEAISASGQTGVGGKDARQQAANLMLTLTAAREAADELGVEVEPSQYAVTSDDTASLESQFPDADTDELSKIIAISKESSALVTAIGQDQAGSDASAKQAQQAGQAYLQDFIADADVSIDPRYGLDDTGQPKDDTDSLSVRVTDPAEDLPSTQQCS